MGNPGIRTEYIDSGSNQPQTEPPVYATVTQLQRELVGLKELVFALVTRLGSVSLTPPSECSPAKDPKEVKERPCCQLEAYLRDCLADVACCKRELEDLSSRLQV